MWAALAAFWLHWAAGWQACAATNAPVPVMHTSLRAASEAALADRSLVLVFFSADWCPHCRKIRSEVLPSKEFTAAAGALHLTEVNIDQQPAMVRDYEIRTVPTIILLTADNKIVRRRTGTVTTPELLTWLRQGEEQAKSGKWEGAVPSEQMAEFAAKAANDELGTNELARLVELLGDANPADREVAAKLLLAQRERAVLPLIDAITNSYLGVRISASEALAQLAPDAAVVDPWQGPAQLTEAALTLRKWWAQAGRLPSTPPQPKPDPASPGIVANALENLRGSDPAMRTRAMSALVAQGAAALPALRSAIQAAEKTGDQRTLGFLEDIRWAILVPDAVDQRASGVRSALARGKGSERQAAAGRLSRAGREAIPALAELVSDSDPLVVEHAVRALSTIGGDEAIPALAALLKAADSNVRMTAAQGLGRTKNPAAVWELLPAFEDPNEVVACTALSAYEQLNAVKLFPSKKVHPGDVVKAFKKCLSDPRWRVRAAAAEIVGKVEMTELVLDLKSLLEDPDGFVVKNALEALSKLRSAPEAQVLSALAGRQPGLRGEVVKVLVARGDDESARAVVEMYRAADVPGRASIISSLSTAGSRPDSTAWKPLLEQAAVEADPQLRRAAASALGAQPATVAAALVGPLLADEDAPTRIAAAAAVLSILSGERGLQTDAHGESFLGISTEFLLAEMGTQNPASTNKTADAPSVQTAAWRAALQQRPGDSTNLIIASALCLLAGTNSALSEFHKVFAAADKEALAQFQNSAALPALLPRLTWPEAQPIYEKICQHPGLFLRMLSYTSKVPTNALAFVLEPARFRSAVDGASAVDLARTMPRLFLANPGQFTLLAGNPRANALLTSLLDATNAVWRAAALFSLGSTEDPAFLPYFERGARDTNASVRAYAVSGLAKSAKDRTTLEQRLAPLLADPSADVVRRASMALLEPETRAAAGFENTPQQFVFDQIYAYVSSSYVSSSGDQRPLAPLESRPAFITDLRARVEKASLEEATLPGLLLAQYGDFSGIDRVVSLSKGKPPEATEIDWAVPAMIALSRDVKYLPYLQGILAAMKNDYEFRRLLQAIKGMTGPEARELRLEINKRLRQATE